MNAPTAFQAHYATQAKVERMIRAAKAAGIDVAGFEAHPDGTIRIMDARSMPKPPEKDLFEQLEAEGKI